MVKNAAGFDLPKLMTGSRGQLGVIVAATFKVLPRAREWRTLRIGCLGVNDLVETMLKLCRLPLDLEAVDLKPPGQILVRISGAGLPLAVHAEKSGSLNDHPCQHLADEEEAGLWRAHREFSWVRKGDLLIKLPIVPRDIPLLEGALQRRHFLRRGATRLPAMSPGSPGRRTVRWMNCGSGPCPVWSCGSRPSRSIRFGSVRRRRAR